MSNTSMLQQPKQLRGSYCDGAERGFDVLERGPGAELGPAAGVAGGALGRPVPPGASAGHHGQPPKPGALADAPLQLKKSP